MRNVRRIPVESVVLQSEGRLSLRVQGIVRHSGGRGRAVLLRALAAGIGPQRRFAFLLFNYIFVLLTIFTQSAGLRDVGQRHALRADGQSNGRSSTDDKSKGAR